MTTSDHTSALAAILPLTAVFDGAPLAGASLADLADRLNEHVPELFMTRIKAHVAAERAAFVALFADEVRGGLAWNDTTTCLRADHVHATLVHDIEEIVRSCGSGTAVNAAGVRVPASPAQIVAHLAPFWERVKRVLGACVSGEQRGIAAMLDAPVVA